jgi:hypothetical protein
MATPKSESKNETHRKLVEEAIMEFSDELNDIFGHSQDTISAMADQFNKLGTEVSPDNLEKILGLEGDIGGNDVIYCLSYFSHFNFRHKIDFQKFTPVNGIEKSIIDGLNFFFLRLNKTGIKGLDHLYSMYLYIRDKPSLTGLSYEVLLNEIRDDDYKRIAQVPLLRMGMQLGKRKEYFYATSDSLQSLLSFMNDAYDDLETSSREYRKKLGDAVILRRGKMN